MVVGLASANAIGAITTKFAGSIGPHDVVVASDLATGQSFPPSTPDFSTIKNVLHDIAEITVLFKMTCIFISISITF